MKKSLSLLFAFIGWFAIFGQYYLMIENRTVGISETTVRFLSYFTILTNILVAAYFSTQMISSKSTFFSNSNKPGILAAITVYITIVGLVYQVALRHLWHPSGLQRIVDELLHSVIPVLVILYWYLYENKATTTYKHIFFWLLYPFVYLLYILINGYYTGFYPYPFVDVTHLGLLTVLRNCTVLFGVFGGFSVLFVWMGRLIMRLNINDD